MTYELYSGTPGRDECDIVAYDDCGTYVHYRAFWYAERGVWELYPKGNMPERYRRRVTLYAQDVRKPAKIAYKPPAPVPVSAATKKKPKPEDLPQVKLM